MGEATGKIREEEDKTSRLRTAFDQFRRENEMLRSELKRLGDLTGDKILELENTMNSVARMKEFEAENFEMERNNIANTSEFVLEQMRVKFGERNARMDDQLQRAFSEREKLELEGRTLLEQLRGFN